MKVKTTALMIIDKYPKKVIIAYVNRGHYLRRNGEKDRAFSDFNTAISLKPEYALSYLNRGNIYFDRNESAKAERDYLYFIELKKKNPDFEKHRLDSDMGDIYGNLGAIYAKTGRYDSAITLLDLAIKINPKNPNHLGNRAQTYFQLNRYPESTRDFEAALQINPDNGDMWNSIGVNYLRQNLPGQAKSYFDKAIEKNPAQGVYYMNRSLVFLQLKDKAGAAKDIEEAKRLGITASPQIMSMLNNLK